MWDRRHIDRAPYMRSHWALSLQGLVLKPLSRIRQGTNACFDSTGAGARSVARLWVLRRGTRAKSCGTEVRLSLALDPVLAGLAFVPMLPAPGLALDPVLTGPELALVLWSTAKASMICPKATICVSLKRIRAAKRAVCRSYGVGERGSE